MVARRILTIPNDNLRRVSDAVAEFGDGLHPLVQDMVDTLEVHGGAGLAAPQIGVLSRVLVIKPSSFDVANPDPDHSPDYWILVNPRINSWTDEIRKWPEGCLSVPGALSTVSRRDRCEVTYQKVSGEEITMPLTWPLSGALQHEIDHLDGVLYIDRLSRLERELVLRRVAKRARHESRLEKLRDQRLILEREGMQGLLAARRKKNSAKAKKRKKR